MYVFFFLAFLKMLFKWFWIRSRFYAENEFSARKKIASPPPSPLLRIKLSYPSDFSHIRYKKTTPFFYLSCKWTVSVRKMVSWIVHMLKIMSFLICVKDSYQFNVNYSERLLFNFFNSHINTSYNVYIAISGCLMHVRWICGLFCKVVTFCRSFFVLLVAK